ncbi:hypothetical protein NDU88_006098 [Pleurodeles waltl]|uniref:Uncharacterized protein n=1 Tax=Pleurodeles waltl TaxID=8319 RepID=A0AAV7LTV1_PLEWA|nr:hypothetical protein NDU88_006098 [Pleurodeles waltl]
MIVTAQLYLRIFASTTPLSKYLQTSGMDILQAQRMVSDTIKLQTTDSRRFETVYSAATKFAEWINTGLEERNCDQEVEMILAEGRVSFKKMPGMSTKEVPTTLAKDRFRIGVYNTVMDMVIQSLTTRFKTHLTLAADIACLDLKNVNQSFPGNALVKLCSLLQNIDSSITVQTLQEELQDFAA